MKRHLQRHSLALAIGTLMAGSAAAQVETVIVTAEFREADVQDTPIAITAVNSAMLEARSQTNIFQVAAQAPNVTLRPSGSSVGPAMTAFIRGIGQTDFNFALEPGVGVYIDDVYYPTLTGSLVDLLDLERVEVLRGPQGTLAGKNSIGGAIKMYSVQPAGANEGTVQLTYGSYNRIDLRGSADFTLVEDRLFARVSGVAKQMDGFVDRYDYGCAVPSSNVPTFQTSRVSDCKIGTLGGQSYTAGRILLGWEPSDDFRATFAADITNDDSEAIASVLIGVNESITVDGGAGPTANGPFTAAPVLPNYPRAGFNGTYIIGQDGNPVYLTNDFVPYGQYRQPGTPFNDPYVSFGTYMDPWATDPTTHQRYSPSSVRPQTTLDHYGFSATFDWNFGDGMSLKWINAWREYDASFAQDEDNTPINSQFLLQYLEHDQWSTEVRLNGGSDRFDYTTGIFWFEQDGTLEANVNLFYVQFNFIHGPDPTPSFNHAVFGHATYDIGDSLRLAAGVRYSEDEKTYVHFRRNIDGTLPQDATPADPLTTCIGPPHNIANPSNCALFGLYNAGATFADERVDWRVAIDWTLGDNAMTYASVSTGYKGGGVNPRPFVLPQLLPFDSEELTSYEIGIKSTLADGNARLNAAVFYNDYTDIIMTLNPCPLVSPGPCALPVNAGSAKVPGIEVELEWHVGDNWLFDASASYLDFEYDETIAPITLDMLPPYTPETKWSAGIQYNIALGSGGDFGIRLDTSYQSEIFVLPVNASTNRIEGYTLSNLRLMWGSSDDLWDASFEITNLSDEYYFQTLFDQFNSGGGTLAGQPGWPRMYAVMLRRSF